MIVNTNASNVELRHYQKTAVEVAVNCVLESSGLNQRFMVEVPTGGGKGHIIRELIERLCDKQILVLTPRVRLLMQLRPNMSLHGVLSGTIGDARGDRHRVIVSTFQTAIRRRLKRPPDVIIIDENHLVANESEYEALLKRYPKAKVIGLTATPYRNNRHIADCGLDWTAVYSISMTQLIEEKYLVAPVSMATGTESRIKRSNRDELPDLTARIVSKLVSKVKAQHRSKCLVFCLDINHAKITAEHLRSAGEVAVHIVHSKQHKKTQHDEFRRFESSPDRAWLINVGLVTIGIDIPCIDSIAILRDIGSFALLVQIIGRGLRPYKNKRDCLILDFGSGTQRFGFIDDPDLAGIDGVLSPTASLVSLRDCPKCGSLSYSSSLKCRICDHDFERAVALRQDSEATDLLSNSFSKAVFEATYVSSTYARDKRGIWVTEHRLTRGEQKLVACLSSKREPVITKFPRRGSSVFVRPLGGTVVEII